MPRRPKIFFNDLQPGLFDDTEHNAAIERAAAVIAAERRAWARKMTRSDEFHFMSFGSGSSGNCYYLGDSDGGFLIDAGVDVDVVVDALLHNAVDMDSVKGIIITHDHSDHVRAVYQLLRRYRHMSLYCTPRILNGILRRHNISRRIKDYHRPIYKEFEFQLGNFVLTAFDVSHDGCDNVGYFITRGEHAFAIATDLGCITERVEHYMSLADHIVIESNYDRQMLTSGRYPEYLQRRIMAERGHLDNCVTAEFVARIASPRLCDIFLCHLSADNNTPELARSVVADALSKAGFVNVGDWSGSVETRDMPIQLMTLPRFGATPMFTLRRSSQGL